MSRKNPKQRGSALVVAIFIIVVMSILAAVIARVLTTTSASSVDEVYGARAFHAANSGAQVFLTSLFPLGEDGAANSACNSTIPVQDFTQSDTALKNCTAEVSCEFAEFSEYTLTHYRIISVGRCTVGDRQYSREVILEAIDEGV